MRKFLLLLCALLGIGANGAWAETTYFATGRVDASKLQTGKKYMIYNTAYDATYPRQWFLYAASNSTYGVTYSAAPLTFSTTDDSYIWTLEKGSNEGTFKIKNLGSNTYCAGGTSLGSDVDYTIAEYSTCPSKTDTPSGNDGSGTTAIASITSSNHTVYIVQYGTTAYWNGNQNAFVTYSDAHVYAIYEVVEIEDDACYTIDFVSKDGTKTWGLKSGTSAVDELTAGETGDVYVAHSYTNQSGEKRWIFVNNSDGTYLAYHGAATASFDFANAISEFNIGTLRPGASNISAVADGAGKVCITNDKRYTNNESKGCYIVGESDNQYNNSATPFCNGTYTSALKFTATGDAVSSVATSAIDKFETLYGGKVYTFTTTDGAFFKGLTTNQSSGALNYANLWLSKNTTDKPQLKLISNGATSNTGDNMRSTGGLYTTGSSFTYNLSVSEGKIVAYAIVGNAEGKLSITPSDGSAEEFEANASVYKIVELATPTKQTSFKLTGSQKWLNVSNFIVKYESDATAVTDLSDIENDGIYTITCYNAERGAMYAGETYLDACGGYKSSSTYPANGSTAIDATDANQQFVIYTHGNNKYLYNIGKGKFVGAPDSYYYKMTGAPVNSWTVSAGAYNGYFRLTSQSDSKNAVMNAWVDQADDSKYAYGIIGIADNEDANNFALSRVGTLTDEQSTAIETIFTNYDALLTNLTSLGNHTIGSGLGEYTHANFTTNEAKETAITTIQNGLKNCAASDIPTANTSVQTLIAGMTLNPVTTGTFLRVYTKHNTYLNGVATTGGYAGYISCVSTPNKSSIFYYDSDNRLIDYGQGYKANGGYAGSVGGSGVAYTFGASATGALGTYAITFTDNETTKYLSAYGEGYNLAVGENSDNVNGAFTLEAVTSLPVTFAGEYASFYSPVDLSIPDGVKVYTGTLNEAKTVLTLNEVTETLPANTGVILEKTGDASTVYFTVLNTANEAASALTGTVAAKTVDANSVLVLGKSDDVWGIYNYKGTTLGGFKAYMDKSDVNSVKGLSFVFGDSADAISAVEMAERMNGTIYNLAGQRVEKAQRGIYIVNGKKVIIK